MEISAASVSVQKDGATATASHGYNLRPRVAVLNTPGFASIRPPTKLAISKEAMRRLFRELLLEVGSTRSLRMTPEAVQLLHEATEALLIQLMADAGRIARHGQRSGVTGQDLHLAAVLHRMLPEAGMSTAVTAVDVESDEDEEKGGEEAGDGESEDEDFVVEADESGDNDEDMEAESEDDMAVEVETDSDVEMEVEVE